MKTRSLLAVVLLLSAGTASVAVAQVPAVAHNTWTTGAPMPAAAVGIFVGVLQGEIYLVSGANAHGTFIADTNIYNPVTSLTHPTATPKSVQCWRLSAYR